MAEQAAAFVQDMLIPPAPNAKRGGFFNMDTTASGKTPARLGYGSGNLVWVRDIENPNNAFSYREHQAPVQCVRFSPGAGVKDAGWVASGDQSGNMKTWTCRADDPSTKLDLKMGSCIRDMAWLQDMKKILVGGEGKSIKDIGKLADAVRGGGNQFGFMEGLSGQVNSVDFTKCKIFGNKIPNYGVACDNSGNLVVYMLKSGKIARKTPRIHDMSQFTAVRIHPNEFYFAACGKKKVKSKMIQYIKVFKLNDYKTEHAEVFSFENCHEGTVTGLNWNSDGSQFVTCSFDKTVKVWNFTINEDETVEVTPAMTITMGKELVDMQCSVVWRDNMIISASVSGELNFCNPEKDVPLAQHAGHLGSIDGAALCPGDDMKVYSVGSTRLLESSMTSGASRRYKGDGHGKGKTYKFVDVTCDGKTVVTGGINDTLLFNDTSAVESADPKSAYATGGAIKFLCCSRKDPSLVVIGCSRTGVHVLKDGKCMDKVLPDKNDLYVRGGDLSPDGTKVILCGMKNKVAVVYIYSIGEDGKLSLLKEQNRGQWDILWAKWYVDNKHYFISTDASNMNALYDSESDSDRRASKQSLCMHTGALHDIAFTPSGGLYTVGADADMYYIAEPLANNHYVRIQNAHERAINKVIAVDENSVITVGNDSVIKKWKRA